MNGGEFVDKAKFAKTCMVHTPTRRIPGMEGRPRTLDVRVETSVVLTKSGSLCNLSGYIERWDVVLLGKLCEMKENEVAECTRIGDGPLE